MNIFGLIGYPLKNTFSEQYFNGKFLSLGLTDYRYHNFPLQRIEEFQSLLADQPNLKGFNITIPHKEQIIPLLNRLDESAMLAGAVNCVKMVDGETIGYNTDVYGFEKSLLPWMNHHPITGALVLGNGGAAKAIQVVLQKFGIPFTVITRSKTTGTLSYDEITESLMASHNLLINCTPAGMFPDIEGFPNIPYQWVTKQHFAYDLIYLPIETAFLKRCKQQGAQTKNGLEMLHLQAEKSWDIWSKP